MKRALLITTLLVTLLTTASMASALAKADSTTLRFTTTNGQSAEIPLGEAFADDVLRNGKKVGLSTGVAVEVYQTQERIIATITGGVLLPEGTLTYAGVNDENPAEGLRSVTFAVTGGTGRFGGAGAGLGD